MMTYIEVKSACLIVRKKSIHYRRQRWMHSFLNKFKTQQMTHFFYKYITYINYFIFVNGKHFPK